MKTTEFTSLPKLEFAHVFQSERYHANFQKSDNTIEISYISHGSHICKVGDNTHVANEGDVLVAHRDTATATHADSFHCHHTAGFSVEWNYTEDMSSGLILPGITRANMNLTKIHNLIDTFVHNPILYKSNFAKTAALFFELVCEIDNVNRKLNKNLIPGHIRYVQSAKEYIQQNLYSPITQNSIAEYLHISPGYLCSIFKKSEGISLIKYVNKIKLENMKTLMDTRNLRLYEVAEMFGYADPNYASRLYKQIFGYNITAPVKEIKKW